MKPIPTQPQHKQSELERKKRQLQIARGVIGVGESALHGHADQALLRAMTLGTKLASESVFYDENAPVLKLLEELQKFGHGVLTKTPETLFAMIDKKYGGKTDKEAAEDIEHYHTAGALRTKVPPVVRNKIYAIRTASMTDAPYQEWNIFEKVGGAFNGRVANFSTVEPLSSGECAVTVALLHVIRPDEFSNEVKIYIGACCHQDGLLTVSPVAELKMVEDYLQNYNYETSAYKAALEQKAGIAALVKQMHSDAPPPSPDPDSSAYIDYIQAQKLLGVDLMVEDALNGRH